MPLNPDYEQIGNDIIGAAFEVRNTVGRGLLEKFYEDALAFEIADRGHNVQQQVHIPALYKGTVISDSYIADIIVDEKVVIEVKAIRLMREVECRQLFTYMKLSAYKLGYLINFGAKEFVTGRFSDPMPYEKGIYRCVNKI